MKMRKFVLSLSHRHAHARAHTHTHARAHAHTLQTPERVAVILFVRQPDIIQSAKQFICKIFPCHVYRQKSKIINKKLFELAR
jgi:hypothetical protein